MPSKVLLFDLIFNNFIDITSLTNRYTNRYNNTCSLCYSVKNKIYSNNCYFSNSLANEFSEYKLYA